ncbi:MAG: DNA-directed RNA polymerase subunit omega [Sphingobacteriales bacterium]|jgi:DNA-directed RNA polymerase subunit K/omega|nr:MAG: DNA-directed RNA polymerase subunit omega [Sphingobacteriales bacterium]
MKKIEEVKSQSAYIETRDLDIITEKTGNLYKSINAISKRSEQLNSKLKEELHRKLEEFASVSDNLEEVFENREQIEISRYYEKLPKTSTMALAEFLNDETHIEDIK